MSVLSLKNKFPQSRKEHKETSKLYGLLVFACFVGYIWIFAVYSFPSLRNSDAGVCLMKHITGIPCPSCGSTRAVLEIFNGHFTQALAYNPLGYILATILFVCPLWIFYDTLRKTSTFFHCYSRAELLLKKKWIAVVCVMLILTNWFWNIYKTI